jgi:hypothetical protein
MLYYQHFAERLKSSSFKKWAIQEFFRNLLSPRSLLLSRTIFLHTMKGAALTVRTASAMRTAATAAA